MATYEEMMAKAKQLYDAGDVESAKRLAGIAQKAKATPAPQAAPERGMGQAIYDNLIGDPNDGVDSAGERLGRGVNDVASAAGAGLARGTAGIVGLPGTLGDLASTGLTKLGQKVGVIPENWQAPAQSPLSSGALIEGMGRATGGATDFRGNTTAGQYAGTIAEFLPGAAATGGASAANLLRFGVVPGATSEAAGQLTKGTSMEGPARIAGALAGGILPSLAAKGAAKIISPNAGADPERLKLASVLDDFGVPISAGQRVGNEALRRREGLTTAGQQLSEAQREAFTAAALKTAGSTGTRATPEVLEEAATRIGAVFDDVTRGVDVTPDPESLKLLSRAVGEYKSLAPTGNRAPLVSDVLKEATNAFRGGNTIPAATVNTWRSGLSKLTTSPDAATRSAAMTALETIDDMLSTALTASGRVDDIARLATARGEWRNFLAIQKAATGAGESAATGLLSPSSLRSAVVQQGRSAYARGKRGDLGTLARAGEAVMKQLPDSGTPAGMFARMPGGAAGMLAAIGGTGGAVVGPWGALAGGLAGAALPGVAGAIRMSGPGQAYLANQLAPQIAARLGIGTGTALLPFAGETRNALAKRP